MTRPGTARRALGITAGFMALWAAGVTWVAPAVIRGAHSGRIPGLGRLLAGRATQPVEGYLASWEPIARGSVVVAWTTALLLLAAFLLRQHARHRPATSAPAGPPLASPWHLLVVAAWVGLLTGLGEAWYYVSRVFYQGKESAEVFGISQHAVWMSPLANLVAFLLAGGVLLLLRRVSGDRLDPRTFVIALAWLSCLIMIMVTGRLHWAAAAVLTLGIAVQVGTAITPGAGEVVALARRTILWLAALVAGLGLLVPLLEGRRERGQLDAAGTAPASAPNVLFIVLDTERAASTSLHGATRPTTPFLAALAQEGVKFERGIAPSSWTLPSHGAMFTGRPTADLRVDWTTPLDDRYPTLAEALSARGYATAGFVANTKYLSDLYGLGRGFGRWEDQPVGSGTVVIHSWLARTVVGFLRVRMGNYQQLRRKSADMVNADFLAWLDRRPARPFFAFLNYFDVHMPYLPPEPWNLRFSETQPLYWVDDQKPDSAYGAAEHAELETAYDASIAYLDSRIGALVDSLRGRDLFRQTVVIITSDHGEEFGEAGVLGHGYDLSMRLVHVPLVITWPAVIPRGTVVSTPVELRHLAATVLSLTGTPGPTLMGESLERYWQPGADAAAGTMVFGRDGAVAMLMTDSIQYLRKSDGSERLFHHRRDPMGLQDLIGDPAWRGVADTLLAALRERLAPPPQQR